MANIWSSIGAEITTNEGEWLYKLGSEVRGPVSEAVLANRIATGDLPLTIAVAKEGGEFHPVERVATFEKSIRIAKSQAARKRNKRIAMIVGLATVVLVALGAGGTYLFLQEAEAKRLEAEADAKAREATLKAKRAALEQKTKGPELVALVSLGSEEEVEIRQTKRKRPRRRPDPSKPGVNPEPEDSVTSCTRSQGAILGTLRSHLAKINVCVQDEMSRDASGLPDQLSLEFVVQTSGSVTDFRILNRHYRTGPMNNCMIKVFRRVKYPSAGGSNCPVTIPIKIRN